ncbi:hypothetical protein NsoK4_05045 [Nitrosopumilus sp. K4]|uniref:hypothetical protein n=1 Tax=Nitrosopumilus sp. K4 TaxID=2795383 RepID=UPI001BA453C4|nr:hypothetical protein [Nitrosopumilus sp. K4]QUC63839.1 hypothetical protein NsoK4_05045 [Nitrosopumilus sp. K4]
MDKEITEITESLKIHSNELAKLGSELSEIQFNYKVLDKTDHTYWEKRVDDFKKYHDKGMEYYKKIHSMMSLVEKDEAGMFLLRISKLHQLGDKLFELLGEVKENPNIMSSKDKQQSKWSKELKEQLIEQSNKTLHHEMDMNANFREFYEKHLKKLLEDQ